MPPEITTNAPNEALPQLYTILKKPLYQAYCESVTDPSLPPRSPGLSLSKPVLRLRTPSIDFAFDAQRSDPHSEDQNNSLVLSAASSPGRYASTAPLLNTGKHSKRQARSPNRKSPSRDTTTGNSDHITQPVTPRGSHLLARIKVIAYDGGPSHPRVQPMDALHDASPVRTIPRKPIPRDDRYGEAKYHPLPLRPLRTFANHDGYARLSEAEDQLSCVSSPKRRSVQWRTSKDAEPLCPSEEESPPPKHNGPCVKRRPPPGLPHELSELSPSGRSVKFEDSSPCPRLTSPPRNTYIREPSRSPRRSVREDHSLYPRLTSPPCATHTHSPSKSPRRDVSPNPTQLPSSTELYEARGLLPEPEDNRQEHRRMQPKEINLKCQFGEYPPRGADLSPQKPSHLDRFRKQTDAFLNADSDPTRALDPDPSLHSCSEAQSGPRPPPWGSYEDLEMQRLQRGDRREVERSRMNLNSRSTLQQDSPGESLGIKPSIVVEELNREIQRRYSDMGIAGQGVRDEGWGCCCSVM